MYNELFESIIRTSGDNTDYLDDFEDRADNFWAPVPVIEQMFEQVLREAHLQEMSDTNPDKTAKDLQSKYNFYKYEIISEKELARKIIEKYSEITAGSEVEYRPFLSNNSPVAYSYQFSPMVLVTCGRWFLKHSAGRPHLKNTIRHKNIFVNRFLFGETKII